MARDAETRDEFEGAKYTNLTAVKENNGRRVKRLETGGNGVGGGYEDTVEVLVGES